MSSSFYSHSGLEDLKVYEPGKPIEELERELGITGAIKLASNENAWGASPRAIRAIRESLYQVHRYPDAGCFYLKKALSKHWGVAPESMIIGNGSDELIVFAVRALVAKHHEVLTATPTFLVYGIATKAHGALLREIPMKDFKYDLQAMRRAVHENTRMIFIANPDNPIGSYIHHGELESFLKDLPKHVIVFLDEAYYEYAAREKGFPKSLDFLEYENVIVSRTFSKAYGLAGLRVGYAFSSPRVIQALNKIKEPFNVNLLAQNAARSALDDKRFLHKVIQSNQNEKKKLYSALKSLRLAYIPSATNFVLIHVGIRAKDVYQGLLSRGIIVRYMQSWGLNEYIRITIGKPQENARCIRILKSLL